MFSAVKKLKRTRITVAYPTNATQFDNTINMSNFLIAGKYLINLVWVLETRYGDLLYR